MSYEVRIAAVQVGFKERIEQEGFKVCVILFSRNPFNFSNIKAFLCFLYLMKVGRYSIVHMHKPTASFPGKIAVKIAGVPPIVYMVRGFSTSIRWQQIEKFGSVQ